MVFTEKFTKSHPSSKKKMVQKFAEGGPVRGGWPTDKELLDEEKKRTGSKLYDGDGQALDGGDGPPAAVSRMNGPPAKLRRNSKTNRMEEVEE